MKQFSIKAGAIIIAASVILGSCKKGPDVNIQNTGNFGFLLGQPSPVLHF
jgi:hypothetical protein